MLNSNTLQLVASLFLIGATIVGVKVWPMAQGHLAIQELRKPVLRDLVDPESARFRDETLSRDRHVLCGEVNSRNRGGGYGGFRKFMSRSAGYTVEGEDPQSWWTGEKKSTKQILAELDMEIEVLKDLLEARKEGKKFADADKSQELKRRIFLSLWQQNCSTTTAS